MNLKRHHVLYALLAMSLIIALLVFLTPTGPSNMSYSAHTVATSTTGGDSTSPTSTVSAMRFEVVTTPAAQELGLGGRSEVSENYGMLFVFGKDARIGFWMKDMLVSIDMIWLSDKGVIVGIEDSVSPSTYPKVFYPPKPVKYVLETRAHEASRRGWSVGTQVQLPLPYGS